MWVGPAHCATVDFYERQLTAKEIDILHSSRNADGQIGIAFRKSLKTWKYPEIKSGAWTAGNVPTTTEGPFGEPLRATGPMADSNPYRFSTKYQDIESGLLYYGYRYYQVSNGRWLSRDPIEETGGLNLYGYVSNNPTDFVDGDGRMAVAAGTLAGAEIGTLILPGVGTVIGAVVGTVVAVVVVVVVVEELAKPTPYVEPKEKECKKCLPCKPIVGAVAYRVDMPPSPPHNGIPTPHSHVYQMNQSPPAAGCRCFWVKVSKDPLLGVYGPEMTPAAGGGVAP